MLTKTEWLALGNVFGAEIEGRCVFQSKARIYTALESGGLIDKVTVSLGRDRFGSIEVTGWALTHRGRYQYCAECERYDVDSAPLPSAQKQDNPT